MASGPVHYPSQHGVNCRNGSGDFFSTQGKKKITSQKARLILRQFSNITRRVNRTCIHTITRAKKLFLPFLVDFKNARFFSGECGEAEKHPEGYWQIFFHDPDSYFF